MAPNILLTGVSGYLDGTLLNEWKTSGPINHGTISALVRNDEQAKEVAKHGVEPLVISLKDEEAIVKALVGSQHHDRLLPDWIVLAGKPALLHQRVRRCEEEERTGCPLHLCAS